ncbi:tRNA pseudouridine(55) synthase TruB [Spirulina subsalsa FACHB-351]|uniref:tRNA pseudouridine synthase B n=2 Tax=Spirulina subsalsa TaxID=54311 RepID=A0ABT3L0F2_9CYAN|nr:tRNA pseudouridine(55) synthase TruB [Spirulina subsalsa FACHB-351]
MTSHDCVARVRRLLKLKRVGHGGTLDPAATGVLPIALGNATRLLQYLPEGKSYRARIHLGMCTSTDDLEGEVLATTSAEGVTQEGVEGLLREFVGEIEQVPPVYSAIKQGGKPLYARARAGEVVEVPKRVVRIDRVALVSWQAGELAELEVDIDCGGGTYIRSIARDLGEKLGVGGTLAHLTRTLSCGMSLGESVTLEELAAQVGEGCFMPLGVDGPLGHLPKVVLQEEEAQRWCQGQGVLCPLGKSGLFLRVYNDQGFLGIGLGQGEGEIMQLVPKTVISNQVRSCAWAPNRESGS